MTKLVSRVLALVGVIVLLRSIWSGGNPYRDTKETLSEYLGDIIDAYGLDTIYTVTVIANLVMLSYWKDIKHWDKQDIGTKILIVTTGIGTFFFNLISFFRLFGLIDL